MSLLTIFFLFSRCFPCNFWFLESIETFEFFFLTLTITYPLTSLAPLSAPTNFKGVLNIYFVKMKNIDINSHFSRKSLCKRKYILILLIPMII